MTRRSRFKIFDIKNQATLEADGKSQSDQPSDIDTNDDDTTNTVDDKHGGYGDSSGFADQNTGTEL